ncbi:50S ribosomal protein L4 [Ignisphaera sp. 4213-co]|uniref:Large ribosomal subunit protein uL4 n=1 Tax=Ignisphaera cupida TaxID=3050454 RepID=A0ABD4Z3U0_9CREN|nr:50S ribosomal protein L4 [Ignisphaera sp. 4213-co]MDK6027976.1 50S ribosomal protein L4 [Ignisphaera sp. 4213-co]
MVNKFLILYPVEKRYGTLLDLNGNVVDKVELPLLFSYPVRVDLIRRAVLSAFTARVQPKGRDPLAGKRRVGESWGIGYSVARVPRLDNGRAVLAPNVVGGRRQFAPTTMRKIHEEINKKEMKLAIISALSALANVKYVTARGHIIPPQISSPPIIIVNEFENIESTKAVKEYLVKTGLWQNIEKAQNSVKIRSGKGKMRGRRYKETKSMLFIVSSTQAPVIKAIRNLPGVDYLTPQTLNICKLAPGGMPGRLAIITQKALEELSKLYVVEKP